MDNLIAGLGPVESSGHFTLELGRALAQLGRLPSFELFVLKLVQSAVVSGASWVRVRTRLGPVEVEHDGAPLEAERLICSLERDPLSIGVYAALSGPVSQVNLDSGGWRCTLARTGFWRTALSPPIAHQRIEVVMTLRSAFIGGKSPEEAVREGCRYCPVPVTLNGQLVTGGALCPPAAPSGLLARWLRSSDYLEGKLHRQHHLIERYWVADCNRLLGPKISSASLPPRVRSETLTDESLTVACTAILAILPNADPEAVLEMVFQGVVVAREKLALSCAGARVVLAVDDLSTDLLGFQLVHDQAREERLERLKVEVARMRDELVRGLAKLGLGANLESVVRAWQGRILHPARNLAAALEGPGLS